MAKENPQTNPEVAAKTLPLAERIALAVNSYGPAASETYKDAEEKTREIEEAKRAEIARINHEMEALRRFGELNQAFEQARQWNGECVKRLNQVAATVTEKAYTALIEHCAGRSFDTDFIEGQVFGRIAAVEPMTQHLPKMLQSLEDAITAGAKADLEDFIAENEVILQKHGLA